MAVSQAAHASRSPIPPSLLPPRGEPHASTHQHPQASPLPDIRHVSIIVQHRD
jgi:hypothetical protein